MKISKRKLKRKIQEYEAFCGHSPILGKCIGLIEFIEMDLDILTEIALKKQGGRKPIPFTKNEFNQMWTYVNNYEKKDYVICVKCNSKIPNDTFPRVHHLFTHSYYDCYINKKMAISTEEGSYHWDCYDTTEAGKRDEQQLIENEIFHTHL